MKVLLVVHQFFPKYYYGTETYTLQLAKGLIGLGHDVVILSGDPELPVPSEAEVGSIDVEGLRVYNIGSTPSRLEAFRSSYCRAEMEPIFNKVLKLECPDIVHFTHLVHLGSNLIALAKSQGLSCVISFTDFYGVCWAGNMMRVDRIACGGPGKGSFNCVADHLLHHGPIARNALLSRLGHRVLRTSSPFWYRIFRAAVPFVLPGAEVILKSLEERPQIHETFYKVADHFILSTEFLQKVYVEKGFPSGRMSQLTYGVPQPSVEEGKVLEARYDLPFGKDRPIRFGFIGQIAKHKGVDLLVDGFLAAAPAHAELKIYGKLGEDPFSKGLKERAANAERVTFCGIFDSARVYDVIAGIDVLCIPSRWHENAPLVLLNGLASKTVMLVSDGYGLTQFVKEGVNGFIVKKSDIGSWEEVIARISKQPAALQKIHKRHPGYSITSESYAEKVSELYKKLNSATDNKSRIIAKELLLGLNDPEKWKFIGARPLATSCMKTFADWEALQLGALSEKHSPEIADLPEAMLRNGVRKNAETREQHLNFGIQLAEEFSIYLGSNIFHAEDVLLIEGRALNFARLFHGTANSVTCAFENADAAEWTRSHVANVQTALWSYQAGLQLPDASSRLVLAGGLFQHTRVEKIRFLLAEVSRILQPGGRCLVVLWGWSGFSKLLFNSKLYHSLGLSLATFPYYLAPFALSGHFSPNKRFFFSDLWKPKSQRSSVSQRFEGPSIQFLSRRFLRSLAASSGLVLRDFKPARLRNYLDIACFEKPNE